MQNREDPKTAPFGAILDLRWQRFPADAGQKSHSAEDGPHI
jgi:hypothetical protein